VINPTQRPLPDDTQHSRETDIHSPSGLEPAIPASEQPQTNALDRVATGTGIYYDSICVFNTKTRLDIGYPILGSQQSNILTLYNDSRTKYSETLSVHLGTSTLETMTSTETWKWKLCLAKSRDLHKSTKKGSTIMRTLRPYSSWTTGHSAQTAEEKTF